MYKSLEELKKRLGIEENTWDSMVIEIMKGVQGLIEGYTRRKFGSVEEVEEFYDIESPNQIVLLKHAPVVELKSLKVKDADFADYVLYKQLGMIKLKGAQTGDLALYVKYAHGYPTVPEDIQEVFVMICGEFINSIGLEGFASFSFADMNVALRTVLYTRYSTEWNVVREILDKYRTGSV